MRKIRVLIVIAVLTCCGAFAAQALATEWAGNGYYLASGQNGFTNYKVNLYASEGKGENRAVCAGIRYYGNNCVGRGFYAWYPLPFYVHGEPYLHNHDSEGGYSHGWYY
jgi:hypothetical protein